MTFTRFGLTGMALALLTAIAGCGAIGNPVKVISMKPDAPDEFQVLPREPLRMPRSLALPEPRPGTPSPLEPDPARDAAVALLGTDARPMPTGGSAGEQALLAAADAASSDPTIRQTIAAEEALVEANRPYEPPYLWEVFGGGPERPHPDAIDATAEARRLQAEGVAATPVDPNDRPEAAESERQAEQGLPAYPEVGVGGPPRNKLPSSRVIPAYE